MGGGLDWVAPVDLQPGLIFLSQLGILLGFGLGLSRVARWLR